MNKSTVTILALAALLGLTPAEMSWAAPMGTAFTYQGQLKQGGLPVTNTADFQFTLWDALAGGNQIGAMISVNGESVVNGLFTATLDFGVGAFTGDARWVEIAVRVPAGGGTYTTLTPRQELTPAPYSIYAASSPPDADWTISGNNIYRTLGNVGIGISNPTRKLDVDGDIGASGKATIGPGHTSTGAYVFVAGYSNTASHPYAAIAGGHNNSSAGDEAVIGGGSSNIAGAYATVAGGLHNDGSGERSAIGGGLYNNAIGTRSTIAGGAYNNVYDYHATIAGGFANNINGGEYGTIGGGSGNSIGDDFAAVSGGQNNRANGLYGAIGGGSGNTASGDASTIAGGTQNTASYYNATIGGGNLNIASGWGSTVPGGEYNTADGNWSFAAGRRAKTTSLAHGSFVWADAFDADLVCAASNRWVARASNGVYFYTNGTCATGMYMAAGGSSWNAISDRNTKENFTPVNKRAILGRLVTMPIYTYNLKSQDPAVCHLGPVAQDFAAFGYGESDRAINMEDADGVALAAIQGMYEIVKEQEGEIASLRRENAELQARLAAIERAVALLSSAPEGGAR